jgi:hypothetical protein
MSEIHAVMTSIFSPTKAVEDFAGKVNLIVVGDKKTPGNWAHEKVTFLSAEEKYGFRLEEKLPYNHYTRKMLGYLFAIRDGATMLYETDDDNLPKSNWHVPDFLKTYKNTIENLGFVNVYRHYSDRKIWPRGFPLELINAENPILFSPEPVKSSIGVFQGLADGDPDVDAIYRLVSYEKNQKDFIFSAKAPIVLSRGAYCPFNSQNTFFAKEVFPLLYLPSTVTFRFTDILRGLVAQPVLHRHGFRLGFFEATVFQERNEHNYLKDFESEIPCYLYAQKVIDIVEKALKADTSMGDNLLHAYTALAGMGLVREEELALLRAWLDDLSLIMEME